MSLTHICKADELNISTMSINFWQLNKYFRCLLLNRLQGDHSGWLQPPVDLVPTVLAAIGPPLQLPTAQAG